METYERNTTNQNNLRGNYLLGAEFMLQSDMSRSRSTLLFDPVKDRWWEKAVRILDAC